VANSTATRIKGLLHSKLTCVDFNVFSDSRPLLKTTCSVQAQNV